MGEQVVSEVHICTVSEAVSPNLAPILDCRFGVKRVVLIHTPDFLEKARNLTRVFNRYQIKTEYFPIESAFDIELIPVTLDLRGKELSLMQLNALDVQLVEFKAERLSNIV